MSVPRRGRIRMVGKRAAKFEEKERLRQVAEIDKQVRRDRQEQLVPPRQ